MVRPWGGRLGSILDGCVNTILKEMGPFSVSSEWHEWTYFHSKWVSYWPGHSIWVPLPLFSIQDKPYILLYSLVTNMAHPEHGIGPPFKQALQSKVEMGFQIIIPLIDTYIFS